MRSYRSLDLGAGLFILLGFAALGFLVTQTTDLRRYSSSDTYSVDVRFGNTGELKPRSPVRMAGVNVGKVESIELDPDTFEAIVTMSISNDFGQIPDDSTALILTSGLLGDKYVGIEPGGSVDYLADGSEMFIKQDAVVLENLISRFVTQGDTGD